MWRTLWSIAPSLLWLLLLCPLERTIAGKKKKDDEGDKKVALPHHSFAVPLAYEEVLSDWMVSGSSLVERERLLLHPSVPERAAFVFNKMPIITNDFEATVHFRVMGPKGTDKLVKDQSFAMWYVYENISAGYNETKMIKSKSWKAGLEEQGMTIGGFKARYNGIGAVLSMSDGQGNLKPSISGVWNDGTRDLSYGKDVPSSDAKAMDFRNTLNAAQFKLRVTPTSIEGNFKQSPSLSWNECFKIDRTNDQIKPGGYIGFTAWSGDASKGAVSDLISIMQLEVYNYDANSVGEELRDVSSDIQDAYRNMLTDENRHFIDQKSQTDHLDRLTRMLSQHADAAKPADHKIFQDLESLGGRMNKLDEDCRTLVKELQILVNNPKDEGSDGHGKNIKDEIVGIRRLLVRDSASHSQKLDMTQKKMQEVKQKHDEASRPEMFDEVIDHSERLQQTVKSSSSQSTLMMLAIVFAIVIIGFLMWNRMSYYERKHFL